VACCQGNSCLSFPCSNIKKEKRQGLLRNFPANELKKERFYEKGSVYSKSLCGKNENS
jgi:hypothetical protein